jgi:hypothetical protein
MVALAMLVFSNFGKEPVLSGTEAQAARMSKGGKGCQRPLVIATDLPIFWKE